METEFVLYFLNIYGESIKLVSATAKWLNPEAFFSKLTKIQYISRREVDQA